MTKNTPASISIPIILNGHARHLSCTSATQTLLEALNFAGLTGTKEGCGDGDCGACTVTVLHTDAQGVLRPMAVNSCLVPTAQLAGAQIMTVEGVRHSATTELHPVQSALVQCGGSQCGYCTPGFVMSLFAAFHSEAKLLDDAAVEGNLCRCTGYSSIRNAMATLRDTPSFALRAQPQDLAAETIQYPGFMRPATLAAALTAKAANPDARWLAGATDLGLEFSRNAQHLHTLIAIDGLAELCQLTLSHGESENGTLEVGAGVSLSRLHAALAGRAQAGDPDLQALAGGDLAGVNTMLHWFAATQVRNRATLGGNLGTASPIGDLLPVLLALDAQIVLQSLSGERHIAAADYFLGYRKTALRSEELVRCVRVPIGQTSPRESDFSRPARESAPPAAKTTRHTQSYKVGKRGSDDISIVSACFVLDVDTHSIVQRARLAYGGIAATPMRAFDAEMAVLGQRFDATLAQLAAPALAASFQPLSDFRGSASYRQRLIVNLFAKFVAECIRTDGAKHA
jgi:xanthine dehydrogenase small subunit